MVDRVVTSEPPREERYLHLASVWDAGAQFMACYQTSPEGAGVLFHPVPAPQAFPPRAVPGTPVALRIHFRDRDYRFLVYARVIERVERPELRGLRLELHPEERESQQLVVACAEGLSIPYFRRRYERIPCSLPAELELPGGTVLSGTCDVISPRGMHVALAGPLPAEDESVACRLRFTAQRRPQVVPGRVVSAIKAGPRKGVGIEYLFESRSQREALAAQVALLTVGLRR